VLLLQNGGFNGESANGINLVLLKAAIRKQNGQRENQSKNVWDVRQGELGGLNGHL
jgi:hypothetical protein